MAPAQRDRLINILLTALAALLSAGGGSFAVNYSLAERVAVNETKIDNIKSDGERILLKLDQLETKIESGQQFVRDDIARDITDLKVDVASLKARK